MPYLPAFDKIRPYYDNEVQEAIKKIVKERGFLNFVKMFFPEYSTKKIITDLLKVTNIYEFQKHLIYPIVERVIHNSITKLSIEGLEKLDKAQSYLIITNHRDIVLDSALLNYLFVKNGYRTTEIAIGSNLLIMDWIVKLVRLNRSFIVKRELSSVELYRYSIILSKYIRYVITEQKDSIWIAQREGRTKDGDDQTQLSVLKMLNLSNEKDFITGFKELNIVPISISYEIEPLAVEKIQGLYNKMINPDYKKTKLDDLTHMLSGIESPKGEVHYGVGTPLNEVIDTLGLHNKNQKEQFDILKNYLDTQIHKNYKLSFYNYVAADIFFETKEYSKYYTNEQKQIAIDYFTKSIEKLQGEKEILEKMFYKLYAMPVQNYFQKTL